MKSSDPGPGDLRAGGLFVLGTDTGVGKTVVSRLLAEALTLAGKKVGVLKPYSAGSWSDSRLLRAAARSSQALDEITPIYYSRPMAPGVRDLSGRTDGAAEFRRAAEALRRARRGRDFVVAEGIGGLLVPLSGRRTAADLAVTFALPAWIVARPGLGTLNHTLLTLEALRRRGVKALRILLNGFTGGEVQRTNAVLLARLTGLPVTVLPRFRGAARRRAAARRWAGLFS